MRLSRQLAACLLAVCACTSTSAPPERSPSASSSPVQAGSGDWPAYHRTPDRAGALASGTFRAASVAWRSDQLDGDVYGSPLIVGGRAYAATENNTVYAFDTSSGQVAWTKHLATPVNASSLPCGDITPISGITGTPVADPKAGLLYVVAFVAPAQHRLFTLSLADGSVKGEVSADAARADPRAHQQRAALALGGDRVYVAYGGLFGDCGDYHGQVVGIPVGGAGSMVSYRVPSGRAAGFWAPSGPALDEAGNLYLASGNSFNESSFDYGNAVVKLSPALAQLDWFAPSEWAAMNRVDGDLGSMGPLLLTGGLLFQAGKPGTGYLLRTSHLGGVGGQAFSAAVCSGGGGAYGGAAAMGSFVYVPCTSGLVGLRLDASAPSFGVAWRSSAFAAGPPIVAGGAVWSADVNAGIVHALDPASGRELFRTSVGRMMHFSTPAAAPGLLLVAAGTRLVAIQVSG